MSSLPPFAGNKSEETEAFHAMSEAKALEKLRMVKRMAELFWPERDWNDLTNAQYEMLTHYANVVMFETMDTLRHEAQREGKQDCFI